MRIYIISLIILAGLIGIRLSHTTITYTKEVDATNAINGLASWYDYKLVGDFGVVCNRSREDCYTENKLTGASRDFPRKQLVEVCRVDNHKCVIVKITDYIEHPDRIIDLSSFAFSQLADLGKGLIPVYVRAYENRGN